VCRTLRLLRKLELQECCTQLFVRPTVRAGQSWLPNLKHGLHVAHRLLAASRLCAAARKQVLCTAAECNVLLVASFFMPLALTMESALARLTALLRGLQAHCVDAYNALLPLLCWLPAAHGRGSRSNVAIALPALLRCDWGVSSDTVTPLGVHLLHLDSGEGTPAGPLVVLDSRSMPAEDEHVQSAPRFVRAPLPGLGDVPSSKIAMSWLLGGTDMEQT